MALNHLPRSLLFHKNFLELYPNRAQTWMWTLPKPRHGKLFTHLTQKEENEERIDLEESMDLKNADI